MIPNMIGVRRAPFILGFLGQPKGVAHGSTTSVRTAIVACARIAVIDAHKRLIKDAFQEALYRVSEARRGRPSLKDKRTPKQKKEDARILPRKWFRRGAKVRRQYDSYPTLDYLIGTNSIQSIACSEVFRLKIRKVGAHGQVGQSQLKKQMEGVSKEGY